MKVLATWETRSLYQGADPRPGIWRRGHQFRRSAPLVWRKHLRTLPLIQGCDDMRLAILRTQRAGGPKVSLFRATICSWARRHREIEFFYPDPPS